MNALVVPHAGTWIEMVERIGDSFKTKVVPHAGTWIEIMMPLVYISAGFASFPTRERGLKWRYNGAE